MAKKKAPPRRPAAGSSAPAKFEQGEVSQIGNMRVDTRPHVHGGEAPADVFLSMEDGGYLVCFRAHTPSLGAAQLLARHLANMVSVGVNVTAALQGVASNGQK